jgi:hypothetical protein
MRRPTAAHNRNNEVYLEKEFRRASPPFASYRTAANRTDAADCRGCGPAWSCYGSSLAFHDGRDIPTNQPSRMANPRRHYSRNGSRGNGDGKSSFLGVVYRRNFGHSDRIRSAADRDLGARDVRSLGEGIERPQSRVDCRPPLRGRDPTADAMGSHLLSAAVQHGVHAGDLPAHEKSVDPSVMCADSRRVHAALRARRALFRFGAALGTNSFGGGIRQSLALACQQLLPADPRSSESPGSPPAANTRVSGERIPYTAHAWSIALRTRMRTRGLVNNYRIKPPAKAGEVAP